MDLKEFNSLSVSRHPWETARLKALSEVLHPYLFNDIKVLDVGCGDGFISENLFSRLQAKEVTAVDINLSDNQLLQFNESGIGIRYVRELPDNGAYDLCMLLDVLEHVESDADFLFGIVNRYMDRKSKILITVPAFQAIYGRHDVNLGHFRRYSLRELESLVQSGGLRILSSGYLFASLLFPKYILCNLLNVGGYSEGVGQWQGGRFLTAILEKLLTLDNSLLIALSRLGVKIPGLTGWVLCEKPE